MVGLDCSIIMHPQVWKVSGHYDLFVDKMVDCKESKGRYRADHIRCRSGARCRSAGRLAGDDQRA
jgi:glycyl-tRNA synthetase